MNPVHVFISEPESTFRRKKSSDYEELNQAFGELGLSCQWVPITPTQFISPIEAALAEKAVVLNLINGDQVQGLSELTMVRALEKRGVPFFGADRLFLSLTNSPVRLKARLSAGDVPLPRWTFLMNDGDVSSPLISFPGILKPEILIDRDGCERGLWVQDQETLWSIWRRLSTRPKYESVFSGALIEEFLDGPIFSVLIIGDWTGPLQIFPFIECLDPSPGPGPFIGSPSWNEEKGEEGKTSANGDAPLRYGPLLSASTAEVTALARHAYMALGGVGYGRVTVGREAATGRLTVLEVKANGRLSPHPHLSILGAVAAGHGPSFASLLGALLENARQRIRLRNLSVFIPCHDPRDNDCAGYCDSEFQSELNGAAAELGLQTNWRRIYLEGGEPDQYQASPPPDIVLNLCDGDDRTSPGLTVVEHLYAQKALFTGADASFYLLSTAKTVMKERLRAASVDTPDWVAWTGDDDSFFEAAAARLGYPYLLKPDVSAMSSGIERQSLVADPASARRQLNRLRDEGVHGVTLEAGLFAEAYVAGREFTVLIAGETDGPETLLVFNPLEYSFNEALAEEERFLFYERRYECDAPPECEPRYRYRSPTGPAAAKARSAARAAYEAMGGCGYARVDTRMDRNGVVFVLEVNANCGLGGDPLACSMGAILHNSRTTFPEFLARILSLAVRARRR
jgi:D-alanine-D-alanine ligase